MSATTPDDDGRLVEEIYDALDEGLPERALAAARIAMHASPGDPVLHFLAGVALLDLDQPEDAVAELTEAVSLDPDDAEAHAVRGQALFAVCAFEEARDAARRALAIDPASGEALLVLAMAEERKGRQSEADAFYRAASRVDAGRFPMPVRLSREAFDAVVARAAAMLPEEFREQLDEVAVVVDDVPAEEILLEETPPLDPELLGLFVGTALTERTFAAPGVAPPPRILLFRRNLERFARDERELAREIARTVHHELAHYLGFEEEQMADLDLD